MLRSRKLSRALAALTIAAASQLGCGSGSQSTTMVGGANAVVQTSGDDPYASCAVAPTAGENNFPNTRVEPYVAVNPASPQQMIGVWQQDRWDSGGARGVVAGYSSDSGATWGQVALPLSHCAPGGLPTERASDPWVSIGPDGIAYVSSISFSFDTPPLASAVATATSSDGGKTWQNVTVIQQDSLDVTLNDKETVTADPTKPGTAYVVWDRQVAGQGSPAWFSKTVNGGVSWSAGQIIVPTAQGEFTHSNQVVVDPKTGALYDFYIHVPRNSPNFFATFIKSTDGGNTWSSPQMIAQEFTLNVTSPATGELIRAGEDDGDRMLARLHGYGSDAARNEPIRAGTSCVGIDPVTGQLYFIWEDARFSGMAYNEVAIVTSSDGGATWSTPARVNPPTGGVKLTPSVQVNGNGVVAVTYYDFRNFTNQTDTLPTDCWIIFSINGGVSFQGEQHVAGSFNMLAAPFDDGGFFLGDYEAIAWIGNSFVSFFVQTNCLDNSCDASTPGTRPTDVFAANIKP